MASPLPCNCPPGYSPSPDGSDCIKITTTPAASQETHYLACKAVANVSYCGNGARFYENVTGRPLSIKAYASPNRLLDSGNQEVFHPLPDVSNSLWGNGNLTSGRLNNAGIWTCFPGSLGGPAGTTPLKQWIGFTVCIDIPVSSVYCIGIAADNRVRFKVNGITIVELDVFDPFTFTTWHVIPITLQAGLNIIHLEGYNDNSEAAFAAEIYNATTAQLASLTTEADLNPFIVFSTKDQLQKPFITGEVSGFSCPTGYYLEQCPTLQCVKIERAPCSVCFQLIDCKNPNNVRIIDADPSLGLISLIGQVIKIDTFGDTCWALSASPDCTTTEYLPGTAIVTQFENCASCLPPVCYILTDCTGTLDPVIIQNDLSQYIDPEISIKISSYGTTCWTVTLSPDCVNSQALPQDAVITQFSGVNPCNVCNPICFVLTDCSTNPHAPVIVTNDLSIHIGQIINIDTFGNICWSVAVSPSCINSVTIADDAIITPYDDCCSCQQLPCYQLTVCSGQIDIHSPIITKTDLSLYIGKVINTVNIVPTPIVPIDPITCWSVSLLGACSCPITADVVTFNTMMYEDCVCCQPVIPPPPQPLPIRVIPGPVKNFTKTDMSSCEIDTLTDFAETFWDLTKQLRFGITTCNWDKNFRKIWVKQQLIVLANSIDSLYCVIAPNSSCTTCNPSPCNCGCNPCSCQVNSCSCSNQRVSPTVCNPCGYPQVGSPCKDPNSRPEIYLLWEDDGPLIWEWPDSRILPETL